MSFYHQRCQPSLMHRRCRYNSIMLGLTLWSINFFQMNKDLLGAAMFVLALSFKQMSLYYSPAMHVSIHPNETWRQLTTLDGSLALPISWASASGWADVMGTPRSRRLPSFTDDTPRQCIPPTELGIRDDIHVRRRLLAFSLPSIISPSSTPSNIPLCAWVV